MAIILDKYNEVKTHYLDFADSIQNMDDGLRCVLDIELDFYDNRQTSIGEFKLIPLDKINCGRTIVGDGGTNIDMFASFGLVREDFIDIECHPVDLKEKNRLTLVGLLFSKNNPYFAIINALAKHFNHVDADNENSFVLDEAELSEINHVPFKLKYEDDFVVCDVENEIPIKEYENIMDELYCEDYGL